MQDSEELEVLFFKAQDSQDASVRARLFAQITSTVATDDPGRIVSSAAHNSLAELKIDEAMALGFPMTAHDDATVLEARRLLRQALKLWPDNAQAAMSLALLERDCGHADRALELWTAVAALEADELRPVRLALGLPLPTEALTVEAAASLLRAGVCVGDMQAKGYPAPFIAAMRTAAATLMRRI